MIERRSKAIEIAISLLNEAIKDKKTLTSVCISRGIRDNHVSDLIRGLKGSSDEREKSVKDLYKLYDKYKGVKSNTKLSTVVEKPLDYDYLSEEERYDAEYDASTDEDYDERSVGEIVRGDEIITLSDGHTKTNKITSYFYHIKVHGKPDLIGELTREEMEMVYRLYSNMDGAGLTQRVVSRYFKNITFPDFKRILRAFNITKSSHPVAPHTLEECTLDELVNLIYRNKENNLFKKLEEERSKHTERILKETQKELVELKSKMNDFKSMINDKLLEDIVPFEIKQEKIKDRKAIVVYLSDMHVGAETKKDSIYKNPYDEAEFRRRLDATCDEIIAQYSIFGRFDKIIICNLGDSLDGYNGETTRGGHGLPQNMDNREQFNVYVGNMIAFFDKLHLINIANSIEYMCVGDSNHDGDFGYIANRTLEVYLNTKYPQMNVRVFKKFIEHFNYGLHTFILTHGKDKEDKQFGLPLNLTEKIEVYFDEYLYNNDIGGHNIHIISGDLHQTSVNYAKRFRYKKVSSLYGSSKWIHTNFGNTKPAVDFDIITKDEPTILEGRLIL